ncbi:MAG: hypothetical protein KDK40_03685, partial [Chlamydiia bacterium]|nr:hypothetical protein [Chlamydiia bacterium]
MIKLPKSLKAHGRWAQELQRHLDEVIFSGPTYQLHFSDPEIQDGAWAFIQLNEQGKLKDYFCSCDSGDAHNGCYHVAAAYLAIYGGSHLPLHIRFEKSLWNRICTIYSHKVGFSPHAMTHPAPDLFTAYSHSGKLLFEAHANSSSGREFLEQLFLERSPETEESSLKFSNLPEIELKLWRQGRPSIHMLYLLSCWNDLARWMLMQQIREEPYTIQFNSPEEGIPNHLHLKFPDISLSFYLSETNLVEIIPSLNDVNSPLKLLNVQDTQIDRISFDPQQCVLNIHHNRQSVSQSPCKMDHCIPLLDPTGDNVPRWFYLPGKGFIHHAGEGLLDRHKLEPSEIAPFLDKHTDLIREKLEGISLQEKPIDPSFHLHFDDGENLHIETFLFERGDLTSADNHFLGSWAYIHGDGFFRLHPPPFDKPNVTIARDRVDRFVTEERSWLVNQPGFVPHIVPIESELTYQLSPEGMLEILSDTHLPTESSLRQIHFNSWIYIEPHGFFSRVCRYRDLVVRPGLRIPKQQVSTFLRMHCDELEHISDFFSSTSPISSCQFSLDIDREERLVLKAHYPLKEEYEDRSLIWFDEWVYAPGEGFSRLPIDPELERFTMGKRVFETSDIDLFLEKEWELLGKTLTLDTPRLIPTAEGEWVARQIVSSGDRDEGGVEMLVDYVTPQGVLSARQLWRALSGDRRYYPSRIGLIDLQAPAFRWLRQLPLGRLDSSDEHLSLTHLEAVRLIATLDIDVDKTLENGKVAESILGLISRSEFPLPPLTGFKSELRPYQEMGVRWLWHLYHHNLSGLLCDDMGLGKTHQAMALICGVYNTLLKHQGEAPPPLFLVVCPTSVIYHWNEKCRKIFPDLSIEVYHGSQRSLTCIKRCDLLITSYGIVRSDIQQLKEIPFTVVLLDEIQVAKNHLSGLYRALKKLTADMVVGLTGTPIENHLR